MEDNICAQKIIAAVNQVFDCGIMLSDVNEMESGMFGGAFNASIRAENLPIEAFNKIAPGRYALSKWKGWILGLGASLHIPAGGEPIPCCGRTMFKKVNEGGTRIVTFDAHLDDGMPWNPLGIGLGIHIYKDLYHSKVRKPCP